MALNAVRRGARWRSGIVLSAILIATAALRLRFAALPFERDEGEYAYMGQIILHGGLPYVDAYNMKLPGVYYANAAILAAFGETDVAIRLALLLINLASIILIERLGRRLVDPTVGLCAAATYALLSLSPSVLGFAAKAEHFVVLPMLAGILLLAQRDGRCSPGRLAAAGLLLGLAVLMKQSGAAFVLFGALYVAASRGRGAWPRALADAAIVIAAAAVPLAVTCLGMYLAGAFDAFWFWTFTYAGTYATMVPLADAARELGERITTIFASAPAIWSLAAAGLTAPWWDGAARRSARFLTLLASCSALAVVPGLRFSEHYFILILPAACLAFGMAVSGVTRTAAVQRRGIAAWVRIGVPLLAIGVSAAQQAADAWSLPPAALSRAVYGANPFPEAVELARYLRTHSDPDDRVAVIGSEPEIYFYARRRAATGYIYMYPLVEAHPFSQRLQENMIAQIERERPRFMVLVNVDPSWTMRPNSSRLILDWAERTVNADYRPVAMAEITPGSPTVYRWGPEAAATAPRSRFYVVLFEREA